MRSAAGDGRPTAVNDLWRTWLMTGFRRQAGDRRRIRGAHAGLKRMLVEGMHASTEKPYTWKDFSDAMIRQAVGEAMHTMPAADAELVKLAYFGDLSNREIATRVTLTEAAVERGLRRAMNAISAHVRRGRGLAQRVLAAIVVWFTGRWLSDAASQLVPASVVAAALLVVSQPGYSAGGEHARVAPAHATSPAHAVVPPMPTPSAPGTVVLNPASAPVSAPLATNLPSASVPSVPAAPSVGVPLLPAVPSVRVPRVKIPPAVHRVTSTVTTLRSLL